MTCSYTGPSADDRLDFWYGFEIAFVKGSFIEHGLAYLRISMVVVPSPPHRISCLKIFKVGHEATARTYMISGGELLERTSPAFCDCVRKLGDGGASQVCLQSDAWEHVEGRPTKRSCSDNHRGKRGAGNSGQHTARMRKTLLSQTRVNVRVLSQPFVL